MQSSRLPECADYYFIYSHLRAEAGHRGGFCCAAAKSGAAPADRFGADPDLAGRAGARAETMSVDQFEPDP